MTFDEFFRCMAYLTGLTVAMDKWKKIKFTFICLKTERYFYSVNSQRLQEMLKSGLAWHVDLTVLSIFQITVTFYHNKTPFT